jgi:2-succinyl-5-enolpyruvyl-6-hydroxy-3-cyclohexene-1-carboxylate synthase
LYNTVQRSSEEIKMIGRAHAPMRLTNDESGFLKKRIENSEKVMVLAGQMSADDAMLSALRSFSKRSNVIVLTEAHSNLADAAFITTIDRFLAALDDENKQWLQPDLLITVGHNIISRKIKALLRKGDTKHWHVDISGEGLDTVKKLSKVIPVTPTEFFESMNEGAEYPGSNYKERVLQFHERSAIAAASYLQHASWSDLKAFAAIHPAIPSGSYVQMGNSSAVRYILLHDARPDLRYFGNRGVAGIDGCTSTALGAAHCSNRLTTLITGDIGFFYDSNALWNNLNASNLRIIVINNGGGGIFRIIDGPDANSQELETFFETAHTRSAAGLAAMYTIPFQSAKDSQSLTDGLKWLYAQEGCAILEVNTPRLENSPVLKEYFEHIRNQG